MLIGICGSVLYGMFRAPTNTPCTPISYPEGNRLDVESTKIYTFEPASSYADVVDFYRTHLKFDPPLKTKYETVVWREYPIRDIGILFQCGSKLNGYEVEQGCIFVHKNLGKSVVDITWSYAEVAATSCYVLPEIEPEDYLITP
jgi:hypothetical protein